MKGKNGEKRKTSFFTVTIIIMILSLFSNPIILANDQIIVSFDPQPSTPSPDPGDGYFPPPNKYPIANITGPAVRYVGKTVIFCAYYSYDTDGYIAGYRWDYNNDGLFDTDWSEDLFTTYIYYIAGNYTVKLQVKDDDGARSTDSYVINIIELGVNQHPPIANASGPYEAFINEDITFNATGSYDPDGTIVLYFWDFGNHNISNLKNPVYSYSKPGDYIVILTVIDNDNLTNSAVATVHIKDNETEERERRQPLSCLLFLLIIIIVIVIVTIFRYIKSVTDKSLRKMDKKSYKNIDAKVDEILSKSDKIKKKK